MQRTVSNSLAVRISADGTCVLVLEEGSVCSTTPTDVPELVSAGKKARAEWLRGHFAGVNARLARQSMTTSASQLLREEERC